MPAGPNMPQGPNALAGRRTLEAAQQATDEGQTALEDVSCGIGWNYAHDSSLPYFVGMQNNSQSH